MVERLVIWLKRTEVKSRTQGPRPRTKKNPRPRTALPRTDSFEAKDTRVLKNNNNKIFKIFFRRFKKKGFQVISKKQGLQKIFSGDLQILNDLKNSAVLEPRTGQFPGSEASRPRTSNCVLENFSFCKRNVTVELKNS